MFIRPRPRFNLVPNAMYLKEKETGKGKGKGFFKRAQKRKQQEQANEAEEEEDEKDIASCEESGESTFIEKGFRSKPEEDEEDEEEV